MASKGHFDNMCVRTSYFYATTCWPTTPIWQLFPTLKLGRRRTGMRHRSSVQDKQKLHAPFITVWQLQGIPIRLCSKYTSLWSTYSNWEWECGLCTWKPAQLAKDVSTFHLVDSFSFTIDRWTSRRAHGGHVGGFSVQTAESWGEHLLMVERRRDVRVGFFFPPPITVTLTAS